MARKRSEHYVNNKEFLEAITIYRNSVIEAKENAKGIVDTFNNVTAMMSHAGFFWGYVSGVFIADAAGSEANILLYGQLDSAKNVTNGDTFSFASGDLDIFFK